MLANIGSFKTYVDNATKSAISFYSAKSLESFLGGAAKSGEVTMDDVSVPDGAKFFRLQCLNSKISTSGYSASYSINKVIADNIGCQCLSIPPDGITDNTSSIQSLIDNGGKVYISYAEYPYIISTVLKIGSNTELVVHPYAVIKILE